MIQHLCGSRWKRVLVRYDDARNYTRKEEGGRILRVAPTSRSPRTCSQFRCTLGACIHACMHVHTCALHRFNHFSRIKNFFSWILRGISKQSCSRRDRLFFYISNPRNTTIVGRRERLLQQIITSFFQICYQIFCLSNARFLSIRRKHEK